MSGKIIVGPSNTNGLTDQFTYTATHTGLLLDGVGTSETQALMALGYQFTRIRAELTEAESELVSMMVWFRGETKTGQ